MKEKKEEKRKKSDKFKKLRPHLRCAIIGVLIGITIALTLPVVLYGSEYSSVVWNKFAAKIPGVKNFVSMDYSTGISILDVRETKELQTAFQSIDYYLSTQDKDGNRYISLYPYRITAGFNLDETISNLGRTVLVPRILSIDAQDVVKIRDDISDLNYDLYIKGLAIGMEEHARSAVLSLGLLERAGDNLNQWYSDLVTLDEDVVPEFIVSEPLESREVSGSYRSPLNFTHLPSDTFEIEYPMNSHYFAAFRKSESFGGFVVIPDMMTKISDIEKILDESIGGRNALVSRIYDPLNRESGGITIFHDGSTCAEMYRVTGSHVSSALVQAENKEVIPTALSIGVYTLLSSELNRANLDENILIENSIAVWQVLEHWQNGDWNSARNLLPQLKEAQFDRLAGYLEFLDFGGTASMPVEGSKISGWVDESVGRTARALESVSNETDYIAQNWHAIEAIFSRKEDTNALAELYSYVLVTASSKLDQIDRYRIVQSLYERNKKVNALTWANATPTQRKAVIYHYLKGVQNYGLFYSDGLDWVRINDDNLQTAYAKPLWVYAAQDEDYAQKIDAPWLSKNKETLDRQLTGSEGILLRKENRFALLVLNKPPNFFQRSCLLVFGQDRGSVVNLRNGGTIHEDSLLANGELVDWVPWQSVDSDKIPNWFNGDEDIPNRTSGERELGLYDFMGELSDSFQEGQRLTPETAGLRLKASLLKSLKEQLSQEFPIPELVKR